MNVDHPILVIVTNRDCSHCIKMRGKNGWPSDSLPYSISSLRDDPAEKKWRWDKNFFETLLQGGQSTLVAGNDLVASRPANKNIGEQRCRVIELFFDTLDSQRSLLEFTLFSFNKDNQLLIRKYQPSPKEKNESLLFRSDNLGVIRKKDLPISFDRLVSENIPINQLKKYIYLFPTFLYVHSVIWERALHNRIGGSLYARVQGLRTVRHPYYRNEYRALKEKNIDREEAQKNPIDVISKLLALDLEPLAYPADHEDEI